LFLLNCHREHEGRGDLVKPVAFDKFKKFSITRLLHSVRNDILNKKFIFYYSVVVLGAASRFVVCLTGFL
jgi:hypothetical protein